MAITTPGEVPRSGAGTPIVFLDIDDVLCLNNPYGGSDALDALQGRHAEPDRVLREIFAMQAKRALETLHSQMDGKLRYVISSSWRRAFSREQIERIFTTAGLGFVVASLDDKWETPRQLWPSERIDEIQAWLRQYHRGEPFVVLDDEYSGGSLVGVCDDRNHPLAERVVLCPLDVGLTAEHLPVILSALRRSC
jgi:hypothetical protein